MFVYSNPFTCEIDLKLNAEETRFIINGLKAMSHLAKDAYPNSVGEEKQINAFAKPYEKMIDKIESEIESAEDRIKGRS